MDEPLSKLKKRHRELMKAAVATLELAGDGDLGPLLPELVAERLVNYGGLVGSRSLVHLARARGRIEAVHRLLDSGADVRSRDAKGVTILMSAVHDERLVRRLLKAGADARARDAHRRTALHHASHDRRASPVVMRLLLDAGAEVDARESGGRTPLHGAAASADLAKLRLLVRRGADVNARAGGELGTPLRSLSDQAQGEEGFEACLKFLRGRGAVPRPLRPGDAFASPLPDGRFGAVKLLRALEGASLVGVSRWVGDTPPTIRTRGIGPLTHGLPGRKFQASWHPGEPDRTSKFLGRLPLTNEEESFDSDGWATGWEPFMASVVLYREGHLPLEAYQRAYGDAMARASRGERREGPARALSLARFWELIERTAPTRDEARRLVRALAELRRAEVRGFQERLARLLYALDGERFAVRGAAELPEYLSPDLFLYQRAYVVGRGRRFFESVLHDPTSMPPGECEDLIDAAARALQRVDGTPDDEPIATSVSFETYSNEGAWRRRR